MSETPGGREAGGADGLERLIDDTARRFGARFGREPVWVASAPGRVNLIGEHTDYNAGFVLPMAIDRWCVCVAASATSGKSLLVAADIDRSVEVSLADLVVRRHAAAAELPAWAKYLAGAMVERLHGLGAESGGRGVAVPELDVLAVSTVPVGGGLSSSAAIETAGAVLIEAVLGAEAVGESAGSRNAGADATAADAVRLARALDCQRAEHRWAGVPCGLMDQLASSFGQAGHGLLIDCRDNTIERVPLPSPDRAVVLVVNSGVRHALASGEYAKRRAVCRGAAAALGVRTLREIDTGAWGALDAEQIRCVRHVVSENARVLRAVEALRADDLEAVGRLMVESHNSLRDDYRVSCAELDAIVEMAAATPGVFGARMTGGGFGGCAVVLATPEAYETLSRTLPDGYRARTGRACEIGTVRASDGVSGGLL
ncbi:MAG: galactokinase [Planctomycetota bacterium]|nr:galactokinase [Planctomycetota bacterium]